MHARRLRTDVVLNSDVVNVDDINEVVVRSVVRGVVVSVLNVVKLVLVVVGGGGGGGGGGGVVSTEVVVPGLDTAGAAGGGATVVPTLSPVSTVPCNVWLLSLYT